MKVRLLNNGGFETLEHLKFPIEVNGYKYGDGRLIEVPVNTLQSESHYLSQRG